MSKFSLPELPYDYAALEPHISAQIMELHHSKHHKAYVDGGNKALEGLEEARTKGDFTRIAALEKALAFNYSGHMLHSLFWQNMGPKAGGEPQGDLAAAIKESFGSFDTFKKQFTQVAATNMGSGWAVLSWDPLTSRLLTAQVHDHQSETLIGSSPIMVLDAWEHAFYLQYKNEKAKFFDAIWNVWNWKDIGDRFAKVRK